MISRAKLLSISKLFLLCISVCGLGVFTYIVFIQSPSPSQPSSYSYLDKDLPIDERVEDLLSQMTLKEKVGQMALVEKNSVHEHSDMSAYGIGGILSGAGAKPEVNTVEGWHGMVREFDRLSRESRLQIPVLYGVDAIHGHANVPGATVFPHAIGLGATRNIELVEKVAKATADELVATGIRWSFSPTLDLPQDIRWGRVYESFSDDPALTGTLGRAYISGLEGPSQLGGSNVNVLATAKHYIGAGGMEWNTSINENYLIDQGDTDPSEEELRVSYLPPFQDAVNAGVGSVMVGLNSWGNQQVSANRYLVTDVLKNELGFEGFVVSDWYGVYEISDFDFYSAVVAINAGIDMVMLPFDYKSFIRNVTLAVKLRLISEERIDDAVSRILRAKFSLGLFDQDTLTNSSEKLGNAEHRRLAREAVAQSLVLLKNDDGVLPIRPGMKRINVSGSAADNIGMQSGAWTVEWQGIDGNWLPGATSILEGIRDVAGPLVTVSYAKDGMFPANAPKAELGIAVVGEKPYAEGWGDEAEPQLTVDDLAAIASLKESSEKVVVVLVTGRPLLITNEIMDWDALVVAWLPGSEGAGVADVLFGKKQFTGTLPLLWPTHVGQLPISSSGETADGTDVLFVRGFGTR